MVECAHLIVGWIRSSCKTANAQHEISTKESEKEVKLSTILFLHGMSFSERLHRLRDWFAMKVARHLIPKRIRYWVTLMEIAKATTNEPNIPATTVDQVLKHLETPRNLR